MTCLKWNLTVAHLHLYPGVSVIGCVNQTSTHRFKVGYRDSSDPTCKQIRMLTCDNTPEESICASINSTDLTLSGAVACLHGCDLWIPCHATGPGFFSPSLTLSEERLYSCL